MENARLMTETREALEQQTATAEVLGVINSSPGDLAPVFDAMLDKAMRLCGAALAVSSPMTGNGSRGVAFAALPLGSLHGVLREPVPPGQSRCRIVDGERIIHIADITAGVAYRSGQPAHFRALDGNRQGCERRFGWRCAKRRAARHHQHLPPGGATVHRQADRAAENFAAQAVIAMENARLLTETREALEQQTATAEVLQVINSSPGDLAPVFDAILEKAHRLCGIDFGALQLNDGGKFRSVTARGLSETLAELLRRPFEPVPGSPPSRLLGGERIVHVADMAELAQPPAGDARAQAVAEDGFRTGLFVPLRKDADLLGYIVALRREVRPYSEKEIALLDNFAAQAVIAMENARLLTETREALEQQTATAEVLQVINSSPGDLSPVFDAILEKAHSLCGVAQGSLELYDGESFHAVATRGLAESFSDELRRGYLASANPVTRPLIEGEPFTHIDDITQHEFPFTRNPADTTRARTLLCVPLRRDGKLLGMIASARLEVRRFTDKQIALLQNFAAQSVIAMENARLLDELRGRTRDLQELLEYQTATSDVLKVINSSPGDLAPVFEAIVDKAHTLCGAACGSLQLWDGEKFRGVAMRGFSEPLAAGLRQGYIPGPNHPCRRLLEGERVAHCADLAEIDDPVTRAGGVAQGGIRTILFVALRKDDVLLGQIVAARHEVRPFTESEIALVENFAAQAVIAMENARLLTETREALEQQTATAEVLQVINSSPGDLAPVFDAMLEKAVRLCDFAFAALWTYDGTAFHPVALHGMPAAFEAYLREHTPPAFNLLHDSTGPIHFPDVMATEMPLRDPEFARVSQQLADHPDASAGASAQGCQVTGRVCRISPGGPAVQR